MIEGTLIDITERKRMETALRRAYSQLETRQRQIEEELQLAARVQQSLVPTCLNWGSISVETFYRPAGTIGEDFGLVATGEDSLNVVVCDVSGHGISSALISPIAFMRKRFHLDIVFANAGVGSQLRLGEITAKHIDETFDINVKGTRIYFHGPEGAAADGQGQFDHPDRIEHQHRGHPGVHRLQREQGGSTPTCARTWAEDLKGTGIRVNVLSPGATATELAKQALGEEGLKAYGSMTALQRMGDPAEVGAAAAFLTSSDSSFMTGSEVAVDGGLAQL